ncbi:hypothetical protein HYU45_01250 [Candidatus Daviesbacteria bacterium]|nr:hypothetical protein [Candidatus Daviesbacteria bacterium]
MKIVFTVHVLEDSIPRFERLGWVITKTKIRQTIKEPKWKGITRFGQPTAMSLMDESHILRVIFEVEDDIIRVITAHIARRGTYESTKKN